MTKKQKVSLGLFAALFVLLMVPSFLPKTWAIAKFLNTFGTVGVAMLIVCITTCIRVDGEPLLDFADMVSNNVICGILRQLKNVHLQLFALHLACDGKVEGVMRVICASDGRFPWIAKV